MYSFGRTIHASPVRGASGKAATALVHPVSDSSSPYHEILSHLTPTSRCCLRLAMSDMSTYRNPLVQLTTTVAGLLLPELTMLGMMNR